VHALSHFGRPDDDGDAIVIANAQIRTRPEFGSSRGECQTLHTRQRENDDESAAFKEAPARGLECAFHGSPPEA
jgi:hypothetical protein